VGKRETRGFILARVCPRAYAALAGCTRVFDRSVQRLSVGALALAGVITMVLMFYVATDVFMRYTLNAPLPDSNVFSQYMLVALVFLGLAYAQLRKANVRMEIVADLFPARVKSVLEAVTLAAALALFSVMAWKAWGLFLHSVRQGERVYGIMNVPVAPARLALCVGVSLFCLALLADLFRELVSIARRADSEERTV